MNATIEHREDSVKAIQRQSDKNKKYKMINKTNV